MKEISELLTATMSGMLNSSGVKQEYLPWFMGDMEPLKYLGLEVQVINVLLTNLMKYSILRKKTLYKEYLPDIKYTFNDLEKSLKTLGFFTLLYSNSSNSFVFVNDDGFIFIEDGDFLIAVSSLSTFQSLKEIIK